MLAGTVVIEDHVITYVTEPVTSNTTYTVCDTLNGEQETKTVLSEDFHNALCIALHYNGLEDVMTAEMQASAEKALGDLRWIP